ncbi:MAG: hypothetical protein ACOX17_04830 [Christensenellales bacterium]|jgi:hypothetical protein
MALRCEIKIAPEALRIVAPEGRLLPGRMLRRIVQNLEQHYQVFEYTFCKNNKELNSLGENVGVVPLYGKGISGLFPFLTGQKSVAFLGLDASFYDPKAYHISEQALTEFRATIPEGEMMYEEDFTVYMPADFTAIVTNDLYRFVQVAGHIKLRTREEMQNCVARLSVAGITVYDEVEMIVDYNDPAIPEIIINGNEEFLSTPLHVTSLEI